MVKVGDKEQIASETFVVSGSEVVNVEIEYKGDSIRFELSFQEDSPEKRKGVEWSFESEIVKLRFFGWKSAVGTTLKKPIKFGDLNGQPVGFQIAHYLIGDSNVVHFEVLLGGSYE